MEDIESLFSDENESGDYDESNDVNFCYNMLWIKVVNVIVSFFYIDLYFLNLLCFLGQNINLFCNLNFLFSDIIDNRKCI